MDTIKRTATWYFDIQVNGQVDPQPTFVDFVEIAKIEGAHAVLDPDACEMKLLVYAMAYLETLNAYEEAQDGRVTYDRQKAQAVPIFNVV